MRIFKHDKKMYTGSPKNLSRYLKNKFKLKPNKSSSGPYIMFPLNVYTFLTVNRVINS